MSGNAALKYRQVAIETASPGDILLALNDGVIRFCTEAAEAIRSRNYARKGERIGQAMAIVGELASTLDHDRAPELCTRLEQLYFYCQDRLAHANSSMDAAACEEVARLFGTLREGWREAVAKSKSQAAPSGATR